MNKIYLFILLLSSCVFTAFAQDSKPIELKPKTGQSHGPSGSIIGDLPPTLSASYTADTLTVEFDEYAGIVVVSIIDEVTDTAVSQTIGHITATANTVQTDISNLPDGNYTLCIVLQTGDEYEGEFTIQRE